MAPPVGLGVRFDGNERGDRYVDESVITTKVKAAILNGSTLKVNEINVEGFKGIVQLSGFVRSRPGGQSRPRGRGGEVRQERHAD